MHIQKLALWSGGDSYGVRD